MSNEEIRGPWGMIHVEVELLDGPVPLGKPAKRYVQLTRYYLNGEPITEDEVRRLVEEGKP